MAKSKYYCEEMDKEVKADNYEVAGAEFFGFDRVRYTDKHSMKNGYITVEVNDEASDKLKTYTLWKGSREEALAKIEAKAEEEREEAEREAEYQAWRKTKEGVLSELDRIEEMRERYKNSWFWGDNGDSARRAEIEERDSVPEVTWEEGGHEWTAKFTISMSRQCVYLSPVYTKDGRTTNWTAIKHSRDRLKAAIEKEKAAKKDAPVVSDITALHDIDHLADAEAPEKHASKEKTAELVR